MASQAEREKLEGDLRRLELLWRRAAALEGSIISRARELGYEPSLEGIEVKVSKPSGKYDWEAIASDAEVPESTVSQFVEEKVDWRGACKFAQVSKQLIEQHYKPGTGEPSVKIALKKNGK